MNKRRFKRAALFTVLVGLLIAGACGLSIWRLQRQEALNRQLVAAAVDLDDEQAIRLLNKGADPNTPVNPSPAISLQQLCNYLLHRSPLPASDSPTAFQILCGSTWMSKDGQSTSHGMESPRIVQAMLDRGINVNAEDSTHYTPLMWAVRDRDILTKTRGVLLEHGANVNAINDDNESVLIVAMEIPASKDGSDKVVVAQLLAHGADPNLPDKTGHTAIDFARKYRPDLVPLLKQAGAKK